MKNIIFGLFFNLFHNAIRSDSCLSTIWTLYKEKTVHIVCQLARVSLIKPTRRIFPSIVKEVAVWSASNYMQRDPVCFSCFYFHCLNDVHYAGRPRRRWRVGLLTSPQAVRIAGILKHVGFFTPSNVIESISVIGENTVTTQNSRFFRRLYFNFQKLTVSSCMNIVNCATMKIFTIF